MGSLAQSDSLSPGSSSSAKSQTTPIKTTPIPNNPNPKQPQSQTTPIPNNPNPKQPQSQTSMSSVLDWAGLGHWASVVTKEFDPDIKGISPNAEQFVRSAMPTLGWVQRTTGHWTHGLMWWMCEPMRDTWSQRKLIKRNQYKAYKLALERNSKYN